MPIDRFIAALLTPLAVWVIVNGFDDLFIAGAAAYAWLRFRFTASQRLRPPTEAQLSSVPQRRIAIFVCLWHEHGVIRDMVEHNIRSIRYQNYDFFIGVYPNDTPTVAAATDVCNRFPNVHLSVTPHPGGTSKADNLNWIFQRMLLFEEENHVRFEMISVHDAEDLIHPDDLRWLNYYAQWYDMVQVPVLALPTSLRQFTHGVYCDEFAEFQFKDLPAREALGGFLPSCGVGTGFSRRSLESVAAANANQIFDATSLTEDYEIGFRIHRLGFPQKFVRILRRDSQLVATREFFAQKLSKAVTQRSRWVTGIALQSWEKHGLRETLSQLYWFWRDRRGLVGSLLTPLTNGLFAYGIITWVLACCLHANWSLGEEYTLSWFGKLKWWPVLLLLPQTAIRMYCSSLVYGWKFAALVPLRVFWANFVNCCATVKAIKGYITCKIRGVPLRWLKTEHAYPNRAALLTGRRKLGEILINSGYITAQQLDSALTAQPPGVRIGEHLVQMNLVTEEQLYQALGLQHSLPVCSPQSDLISPEVTRAIPADLARQNRILPFRVVAGQLYVASPEPPNERILNDLRQFWPLEMRFHLVPPNAFQQLLDEYLPPLAPPSVPLLLTGLGLLASLLAISRTILAAKDKHLPERS
jgi:adsorption protein B